MQPHDLGDRGLEPARDPAGADLFMLAVDRLAPAELGMLVEQMAEIMQQRAAITAGAAPAASASAAHCSAWARWVTGSLPY